MRALHRVTQSPNADVEGLYWRVGLNLFICIQISCYSANTQMGSEGGFYSFLSVVRNITNNQVSCYVVNSCIVGMGRLFFQDIYGECTRHLHINCLFIPGITLTCVKVYFPWLKNCPTRRLSQPFWSHSIYYGRLVNWSTRPHHRHVLRFWYFLRSNELSKKEMGRTTLSNILH